MACHKNAINESRIRKAERQGTQPILIEDCAKIEFTSPFSKTISNAQHRKIFQILAAGLDLPRPQPTTKISKESMNYAVAFILNHSHYRPGKIRSCLVNGSLLKNLPLCLRYSSVHILWNSYLDSLNHNQITKIGYHSFRTIVGALTRTGTFNQGLSYFYVNHIDQMNELRRLVKRMKELMEGLECGDAVQINKLITRLSRSTHLSSKFLRHNFYSHLTTQNSNLYTSSTWALGAEDCRDRPNRIPTDPLLLAFTLRPLMNKISHQMMSVLPEESGVHDELKSIKLMAKVIEHEVIHFTKHTVRGWWQEQQQRQTLAKLKDN